MTDKKSFKDLNIKRTYTGKFPMDKKTAFETEVIIDLIKRTFKNDHEETGSNKNEVYTKSFTYDLGSRTENHRRKQLTISFNYLDKDKERAEIQIVTEWELFKEELFKIAKNIKIHFEFAYGFMENFGCRIEFTMKDDTPPKDTTIIQPSDMKNIEIVNPDVFEEKD